MDYGRILEEHERRGAEVTVACIDVPIEQAPSFGVVRVDDAGRVRAFDEKPARPTPMPGRSDRALASMGIYVFDAEFLYRELRRDASDPASHHDFGHDLLPALVPRARVYAHDFAATGDDSPAGRPYWRDVGTIDAYWAANHDLTRPEPDLDLYDVAWPIHTLAHQLPPSRFVVDAQGRHGVAADSRVAGGCVVRGAMVRRSVLFTLADVGAGSLVEDALVLPGARVGRNVRLRRVIVDKHCVLPDGLTAGEHPEEDRARFHVTGGGVTLIVPEMLGQCVHEAC
jgi:glucose-1-phosphate adenylyltransferase